MVVKKSSAKDSWLTKSTGNKKPIAKKSTIKKVAEKGNRKEGNSRKKDQR
jgi:hypothetical protein